MIDKQKATVVPFALPVRVERGYLVDAHGARVLDRGGPLGWLPTLVADHIARALNAVAAPPSEAEEPIAWEEEAMSALNGIAGIYPLGETWETVGKAMRDRARNAIVKISRIRALADVRVTPLVPLDVAVLQEGK